jgi:hypothetical protein
MVMSGRKDVNDLLRRAEELGATIDSTRSGHRRVRYGGRTVIVSLTPSDCKVARAVRADLRRMGLAIP